jgi:hypothetical protein
MSNTCRLAVRLAAGLVCVSAACLGQEVTNAMAAGTADSHPDLLTDVLRRDFSNFTSNRKLELRLPWNGQQHTFLFGPQVRVFAKGNFAVKAWVMGGALKRSALVTSFLEPTDATQPVMGDPAKPLNTITNGANQAAASVGASAEWRITDHLTYRLVQPEWLFMDGLKNVPHRDFRISTGMHFEFGKQ